MHGWRHVTDLIEKYGAAVGRLEEAYFGGTGTGEGIFLVAEEFIGEQLLCKSPTVEGEETFFGAVALVVNCPGDQFLAGSCLSEDEDTTVGGSNLGRHLVEFLHLPALTDDKRRTYPRFVISLEVEKFILEPFFFQRSLEDQSCFFDFIRLGNVVISPFLHCLDGGFDGGVGGNHNHFSVWILLLGSGQHLHAVHLLHFQIGEDQVKICVCQFFQRLDTAVHRNHIIPLFLQDVFQILPGNLFVINDENFSLFHEAGSPELVGL